MILFDGIKEFLENKYKPFIKIFQINDSEYYAKGYDFISLYWE